MLYEELPESKTQSYLTLAIQWWDLDYLTLTLLIAQYYSKNNIIILLNNYVMSHLCKSLTSKKTDNQYLELILKSFLIILLNFL